MDRLLNVLIGIGNFLYIISTNKEKFKHEKVEQNIIPWSNTTLFHAIIFGSTSLSEKSSVVDE